MRKARNIVLGMNNSGGSDIYGVIINKSTRLRTYDAVWTSSSRRRRRRRVEERVSSNSNIITHSQTQSQSQSHQGCLLLLAWICTPIHLSTFSLFSPSQIQAYAKQKHVHESHKNQSCPDQKEMNSRNDTEIGENNNNYILFLV